MRVVFMGTPEFSVPILRALVENGYEVAGVFTQPDKPRGRGGKVQMTPVKEYALSQQIPVFQPLKIRKDGLDDLKSLAPDLCVTAAFGQILSQEVLDVPKIGTVNVHTSLLPRHRGAAPVQWTVWQGETVTGVTTMFTDAGVDTGDIALKAETPIGEMETAGELTERLSHMGAALLIETLHRIEAGDCPRIKQDEALMSRQPMLSREDGLIDWTKSAREIACRVRGFNPWPGTFTYLSDGGVMKLWLARAVETEHCGQPGEVIESSAKKGLFVACGEGVLEIIEMQAPGSKRMNAKAYLMGKPLPVGTIFDRERITQ